MADLGDGEQTGHDAPFAAVEPLATVEKLSESSAEFVIALTGEVDISNAAEIGAELARLIALRPSGGSARLVVDASALEFMDSSGIAMLLHACSEVDSIAIRRPSHVIRRLIEATGLSRVLPFDD